MERDIQVRKSTGELEPFSRRKLADSLRRAGAGEAFVGEIVAELGGWIVDGTPTRKIYDKAFALLRRRQRETAARYRLKRAMLSLGPTGRPFEILMGEVARLLGYDDIRTGIVLPGKCVTHEMDVTGRRPGEMALMECKFHADQGKRTPVQVALYVRSRVDDIADALREEPRDRHTRFTGWVVTNTKFSDDAISFGECAGLQMLSWDYPRGGSLREIMDRWRVFPVTILKSLTRADAERLLAADIVLCRQLAAAPQALSFMAEAKARAVMREVGEIMQAR